MAPLSSALRAAVLSSAAAALFVVAACSSDAAQAEAAAGATAEHSAGSSNTSGKSGASSVGGASGVGVGNGGASGVGVGKGGAGPSPSAGTSGAGKEATGGDSTTANPGGGATHTSGGAPTAGAGSAPPGPAPGGGSVYAVECKGETAMCGVEGSRCLGINLDQGGFGYACSNQCDAVADCSHAPSGAAAEAGCVQFTKEKRCVLVCYDQPNEYACPSGMDCYIYPNSPIGYCLWMK
jgi:hypothetical protein